MKISKADLVAEKFGIITLCKHCGERIEIVPTYLELLIREILLTSRRPLGYNLDEIWMHVKKSSVRCDPVNFESQLAEPRKND